jgi:cell division septation protein DedD
MDKALKQRLVGASVLIALAVVVLPMLLSGQSDNQQEARKIEVPPKPAELSFETRRFPVGDQANEMPSVVEAQTPEPAPQSTENAAETPAVEQSINEAINTPDDSVPTTVQVVDPPSQENTGDPGPAEVPASVHLSGRYLVQVASFSTTSNANRLAGRLREDGLDVMMDTIDAAVGTLHRVRVGPFSEIESANNAMTQIRARTPDVTPRIIDLRPDESAPVTDPSDPLVRWVVQVGSFESQTNAEELVKQLRNAGFSAYSIAVNESDRTRYKVRVGPEIERQSAVRISSEIRGKLNLEGMVISVD